MTFMNRLGTAGNRYQGKYKRVLCVCSAGLLRSPTAAFVLSQEPYNFNTRAAGATEEYALIPVDEVLLAWANEVVCMEDAHKKQLIDQFGEVMHDVKVVVLNIPDHFAYRDPELIEFIKQRYNAVTGVSNEEGKGSTDLRNSSGQLEERRTQPV